MKNINLLGLFDDHFLMEKLTKLGDPLDKLNKYIDWKIFEKPIIDAFIREDKDMAKGGCPPFARLMAGATCSCQGECAPGELKTATGKKLGQGCWFTVEDFDSPDAIEQFLMHLGYQNQWILNSNLGLLRIYSTDPWGNEIDWEVEPGPQRLNF